MEILIARITLNQIWGYLKSPKLVIAYMAFMVVLMGLIVVTAMVNERRLNKISAGLKSSAEKAEAQANAENTRFDALTEIDKRSLTEEKKSYLENYTLSELCEEFRNFAAGKLNLYYDIDSVRAFIGGLAVSHFMILQGMSGTGKTSMAFAFGEFLNNPSALIPVQPMWKERSDLLGYYNEFTKRFNETPLLQKMYEANKNDGVYVTILDELNIARVEYYFAEFLSLMEIPDPELRYLEIVSDKQLNDPVGLKNGAIKLPDNMWFLGTANNDDSTFAISDKVYDRAMIVELDKKAEPFEAETFRNMPISYESFVNKVRDVIRENGVSEEISEKISRLDDYLQARFRISFGNRIIKQIKNFLPVYTACGGEEIAALDDILAKKVLRKLETQNATYRKKDAEELVRFLEELFGEGNTPKCVNFARSAARNG